MGRLASTSSIHTEWCRPSPGPLRALPDEGAPAGVSPAITRPTSKPLGDPTRVVGHVGDEEVNRDLLSSVC